MTTEITAVQIVPSLTIWSVPKDGVTAGHPNVGASYTRVPKVYSPSHYGDPLRILHVLGVVSHPRIGQYDF